MTTWRRRSEVLWRVAPNYLVLASVDGQILEIEGPGGEIWAMLDDWVTEEVLVASLASRYGAAETTVAADLVPLLARLYEVGYVARID